MITACYNCGSHWIESYGIRCMSCGAINSLLHEDEAQDTIASHIPDPQPSSELLDVVHEGESHV